MEKTGDDKMGLYEELLEFSKEYLPYKTFHIVTPEKKIKVENKTDYNHKKELFIKQIKLAIDLNKPIIVHSRDALQDTFDIMKEYKTNGVMHCYSGSYEMAKEFSKLGYYISLAGTVTFKNAVKPKEVATKIDLDKLLIETDCPYMTPVPFRGKRNEPMLVKHTGKYIVLHIATNGASKSGIINFFLVKVLFSYFNFNIYEI